MNVGRYEYLFLQVEICMRRLSNYIITTPPPTNRFSDEFYHYLPFTIHHSSFIYYLLFVFVFGYNGDNIENDDGKIVEQVVSIACQEISDKSRKPLFYTTINMNYDRANISLAELRSSATKSKMKQTKVDQIELVDFYWPEIKAREISHRQDTSWFVASFRGKLHQKQC